jgi:hypothetical protein
LSFSIFSCAFICPSALRSVLAWLVGAVGARAVPIHLVTVTGG